jgi:hypothetical protein
VLLLLVSVLHAVGSSVIFGVLVSFPLGLIATLVAYQRVAQPALPVTLSAQPVG